MLLPRAGLRRALAGGAAALLAALAPASADAEPRAAVRIEGPQAVLRAAPSAASRVVGRAVRGDTLPVLGRDPSSRWYRVRQDDGTAAYLVGDEVTVLEAYEETGFFASVGRALDAVLARSAYEPNAIEAAVVGGALLGELGPGAAVGLRAAYLRSGFLGLEGSFTEIPGEAGALRTASLGLLLQLGPGSHVTPFLVAGGGFAAALPSRDEPLGTAELHPLGAAAGGLKLALTPGLAIRLEGRYERLLGGGADAALPGAHAGAALHF